MYNTVLQKHDTTSFPLIFQTNFRQKAIQPRLFAHLPLCIAVQCAAQWFQMAQTRQKLNSLMSLHNFQKKIQIISVSQDCLRFISKICQTVADM